MNITVSASSITYNGHYAVACPPFVFDLLNIEFLACPQNEIHLDIQEGDVIKFGCFSSVLELKVENGIESITIDGSPVLFFDTVVSFIAEVAALWNSERP